jgi:hypothetical protein
LDAIFRKAKLGFRAGFMRKDDRVAIIFSPVYGEMFVIGFFSARVLGLCSEHSNLPVD